MLQANKKTKIILAVVSSVFLSASTSAAVPKPSPRPEKEPAAFSEKAHECLSTAIYFEARGEPTDGQEAVARVILNRVDSAFYPDTVCDVVYQNDHMKNACQFSFACDGIPEKIGEPEAYKEAEAVAADVLECDKECRESASALARSTHYHADFVSPGWAKKLERTGKVGSHIFYYTASM